MSDNSKLKPCPFCGGNDIHKQHVVEVIGVPLLEELTTDAGGGWRVICYLCETKTYRHHKTAKSAIKHWNTRAPATSSERVSISRRCAENSLQRAEHDTDPSYDKLIVLAAEKDRKELKAALEKDND